MSLRPIHYWYTHFALLLSRVTTPIILGVVFFLVSAPVALVVKIFVRDPMARKFDDGAASYRVPSGEVPPEQLERPF